MRKESESHLTSVISNHHILDRANIFHTEWPFGESRGLDSSIRRAFNFSKKLLREAILTLDENGHGSLFRISNERSK